MRVSATRYVMRPEVELTRARTLIYLNIVQTAFQSYHIRPRKRHHELREKSSIDDPPRHAREAAATLSPSRKSKTLPKLYGI